MLGVFDSVDDATQAISEIIGAGIIPAALEMMDQGILVAVEEAFHFGFPLDAEAILLIEVDGLGSWARCPARPRRRDLPPAWSARSAFRGRCEGAIAIVEVPQAGVRRDRPVEPQLLHARRRRAALASCRISCSGSARSARSTTFGSSTCFTPATATCIRSCCSTNAIRNRFERVLACQRRNSQRVLRLRRQRHRRAWHRRGKDQLHEPHVHRRRSRRDGTAARRAQPDMAVEPGKLLPTAGACGMEQVHPGRRAALMNCTKQDIYHRVHRGHERRI